MPESSMDGRIDSVVRIIKTSPETLYQAYMNPDSLVKWLPPSDMTGEISYFTAEVGEGYTMTLTYETGHSISGKSSIDTDVIVAKFIELIPNKKIVIRSVFDSDNVAFTSEMRITWYFEAVDEGTKVIIVAENVPDEIKKIDHLEGLHSSLENLKNFILSEIK